MFGPMFATRTRPARAAAAIARAPVPPDDRSAGPGRDRRQEATVGAIEHLDLAGRDDADGEPVAGDGQRTRIRADLRAPEAPAAGQVNRPDRVAPVLGHVADAALDREPLGARWRVDRPCGTAWVIGREQKQPRSVLVDDRDPLLAGAVDPARQRGRTVVGVVPGHPPRLRVDREQRVGRRRDGEQRLAVAPPDHRGQIDERAIVDDAQLLRLPHALPIGRVQLDRNDDGLARRRQRDVRGQHRERVPRIDDPDRQVALHGGAEVQAHAVGQPPAVDLQGLAGVVGDEAWPHGRQARSGLSGRPPSGVATGARGRGIAPAEREAEREQQQAAEGGRGAHGTGHSYRADPRSRTACTRVLAGWPMALTARPEAARTRGSPARVRGTAFAVDGSSRP